MSPTVIAALIVQFGLPFVEKLIQLWADNTPITPESWAGLKALVKTPEDALSTVAAQAGLPMTDPKIVALSELIKPRTA